MSDGWESSWEKIKAEANEKKEQGLYDYIFFIQLYPDNFSNYDGTIRSSLFRNYPTPITVPVAPVLILDEQEIENVDNFVKRHKLKEFKNVRRFEELTGQWAVKD